MSGTEPTSPWRHDPGISAWSFLLRAHAAVVRKIERDLETATGMSLSWYDVLLELNAAPARRLRMSELGEKAVLSRTRVSRIVDELAEAGHVQRSINPDDRRSSYAEITTQGRAAFRRTAPKYLATVREHFSEVLTPEQLGAVREAMQALLNGAGSAAPDRSSETSP